MSKSMNDFMTEGLRKPTIEELKIGSTVWWIEESCDPENGPSADALDLASGDIVHVAEDHVVISNGCVDAMQIPIRYLYVEIEHLEDEDMGDNQ